MEADWEIELGGDAPVIDGFWSGFLNLRKDPGGVDEIAETKLLPGLAQALVRLNEVGSPVWTSKTDVFVPDHIDPDELAATGDEAAFAISCYVDILPATDQASDLTNIENGCKDLCARLKEVPLRRCRADLVVRRTRMVDDVDLGTTVYLTACGPTSEEARQRLTECLAAFAELVVVQE